MGILVSHLFNHAVDSDYFLRKVRHRSVMCIGRQHHQEQQAE
jgi:hypothetical protein